MRRAQLVYDGLWRCLCPAFDERALCRAVGSLAIRQPTRLSSTQRAFPSSWLKESRQHGAGNAESSTSATNDPDRAIAVPASSSIATGELTTKTNQNQNEPKISQVHRTLSSPQADRVSTDTIIAALNILRNPTKPGQLDGVKDRHALIVFFARTLITKRNHPLTPFIYECMMDAMIDPKGSAKAVSALLKDMVVVQGLAPTAKLCDSALQALAVHPDYIARQEVIDLLKKYWLVADRSMDHSIMLAMLREGQYERAFAKFIALREENDKTELWLYDIFLVVFGQEGFLDEALQILEHRKHAKGSDDSFRSLLLYFLDLFSKSFHYNGTAFVWDSAVKNRLLNPSNTMIENSLATAARHGDAKLATEALDILCARGRVTKYHYEGVLDAFAGNGDMAGALKLLTIMDRSLIKLDRGSTRTIFQAMQNDSQLINEAMQAMKDMHKETPVHIEAIRVTLEALVRSDLEESTLRSFYANIFLLSGVQPDKNLLRDLIINATDAKTIHFLAKEYMAMLGDTLTYENPTIYERAIKACADFGDLDFAFHLANRNINTTKKDRPKKQLWRSNSWVPYLVDRALVAKDERVWDLVDEINQVKDDAAEKVNAIVKRRNLAAKIGQAQQSGRVGDEAVEKPLEEDFNMLAEPKASEETHNVKREVPKMGYPKRSLQWVVPKRGTTKVSAKSSKEEPKDYEKVPKKAPKKNSKASEPENVRLHLDPSDPFAALQVRRKDN